MSFLPPSDYILTKLLGENPQTCIWLAEQVSVRRNVVLEQLRNTQRSDREEFLAAVRAKASVDHPLIASVYEAINDEDTCFFTREWLPGDNLAHFMANGVVLKPAQVAHIIKRIAEASMHLEERGTATSLLSTNHIYLNEHNVLRLSNLAKAGNRSENASRYDIETLGQQLPTIVEPGATGQTRLQMLMHWMTGADPEHILQWKDIRHYADQIEQQLATPIVPLQVTTGKSVSPIKKNSAFPWIIGTAAVLCIALVVLVLKQQNDTPSIVTPEPLSAPILIPEGKYATPDGGQAFVRKFWLSAHEVTIGEYREFIQALDTMEREQRKSFDHESQPPGKVSHEPEDWYEIIAAAEQGQVWQDRKLTLQVPMFQIDWWDAHAYCEWKRARLPTQEEWFAAMNYKTPQPTALKPGAWNEVQTLDQNGAGFFGMAGGVSEWTRKQAKNPSNPLGAGQYVIIGASFEKTANGAFAREWTNNRDTKRNDLGFRVGYDHQPE